MGYSRKDYGGDGEHSYIDIARQAISDIGAIEDENPYADLIPDNEWKEIWTDYAVQSLYLTGLTPDSRDYAGSWVSKRAAKELQGTIAELHAKCQHCHSQRPECTDPFNQHAKVDKWVDARSKVMLTVQRCLDS